jgi:DNA-binding HxlR family transcriptional regulator
MVNDVESPKAELMQLIADYCTLRVIDALRDGELRYNQILRTLGDANTVTLCSRLKRLESAQLIQRDVETLDKQSVAYSLTKLGRSVLPVVDEFYRLATKLEG